MNVPDCRKGIANRSRAGLIVLSALLLPLLLPACGAVTSSQVKVVTTSNIVADWVRQVGGERVSVFPMVAIGADPHTFQPGAGDVARVAKADIIFTIGLGLEGTWLSQLLTNASTDPSWVVALGDYVDPLAADQGQHGNLDPHFWWDPLRVKEALNEVVRRLVAADAAGADTYRGNGAAYAQALDQLHSRILQLINEVPPERRVLVTSHETMNYFAGRYGFKAIGSIFPGISTEQEPSPAELAALVDSIRKLGVPAIFTENTVSDRLARTVASETGVKIVRLYSDSLGPAGSGAETYIGMMDTDVKAIVQALK